MIASRPVSEKEHDPFENSLSFLSGLLKIDKSAFPSGLTLKETPDIVIALGADYHFTSVEKLVPADWIKPEIAKP